VLLSEHLYQEAYEAGVLLKKTSLLGRKIRVDLCRIAIPWCDKSLYDKRQQYHEAAKNIITNEVNLTTDDRYHRYIQKNKKFYQKLLEHLRENYRRMHCMVDPAEFISDFPKFDSDSNSAIERKSVTTTTVAETK